MRADDRLYQILDRWVAEADSGRLLPVAELCRDCPELIPEAERRVAALRQFHALSRPDAHSTLEVQTKVDTAAGAPPPDHVGKLLLRPGTRFGRYQVLEELGRGGMGIVCRAHDMQLDREVALKLMRPDVAANPSAASRF